MRAHHFPARLHLGELLPPGGDGALQAAGLLSRRFGTSGNRRGPCVHGEQLRLAQRRLLEAESQGGRGLGRITDADHDLARPGLGFLAHHHDWSRRVRRDVPAHRAEDHRAEAPVAARAQDQHGGVLPGPHEDLGRRSGQQLGVDRQAGLLRRGLLRGRGQGLTRGLLDHVGHRAGGRRGGGHPRRQLRDRHDPQRRRAEHRLPGGPFHRPQGLLRAICPRDYWLRRHAVLPLPSLLCSVPRDKPGGRGRASPRARRSWDRARGSARRG